MKLSDKLTQLFNKESADLVIVVGIDELNNQKLTLKQNGKQTQTISTFALNEIL